MSDYDPNMDVEKDQKEKKDLKFQEKEELLI